MKDFYYILGTDLNSTTAEIRDAYRKLSKKFHPDLNQGDKYFENRFKEINEAYETLNDPGRRFQYDKDLKNFRLKNNTYQNNNRNSHAESAAAGRTKTRRSGTAFTLTIIMIVIILGIYLVESFSSSKKHKVNITSVLSASPPLKTHKHHKQKHALKTKADSAKPHFDSIRISSTKPKTAPVMNKDKAKLADANFLYIAYVHSNLTGVVNMRQSDRFNSDIIEKIPANSKVFVMEKGEVYDRVLFNNHIGYVPKWAVQKKQDNITQY